MKVERCHNIAQIRTLAARALPRPVFDYIDGGAEDENSLINATSAFDRYHLLPRVLSDVTELNFETEVFGRTIPWPLMLSPTGLTRLFHHDGELAVAKAATVARIPYCLSSVGTTMIEDFGKAVPGPKLFQLYIFKDRGLTEEFIVRAREAGYDGLVLTADTLVGGKRERDLVNGFNLPLQLTMKGFFGFAMKPRWSLSMLFGEKPEFVNVAHRVKGLSGESQSLPAYMNSQLDRSLTWRDVEWLAERWGGPLAIKGIMRPEDARLALAAGANTIMVSNHGGRQLDTAAAPIDQIAPIADAVGGQMKIICDGGIRRGTHIVKALALGADACSIGRPYLFGLAAGGTKGVATTIELLREEFERSMILIGANSPQQLDRTMLRHDSVLA